MPGFDGTGPLGYGPASGRGFGPCGMGFGWKRRLKTGRFLGSFFNWGWSQNPNTQKTLAKYRQVLEKELEEVRKHEEEIKMKK